MSTEIYSKKRTYLLNFCAFLIPCLLLYLPVLQTHYLHTDDYFWSYWGGWNFKAVLNFMNPIGRPMGGIVYYFFSKIALFKLTYLFRVLAVINIALTATLFYQWLLLGSMKKHFAFALAFLTVSLPPFQIFASYISTVPHGLSVTLSLIALFYWDRKVICIFLFAFALSFNQVGALFFISATSLQLALLPVRKIPEWIKNKGAKVLLHSFFGIGLYYSLFRLYKAVAKDPFSGKYDPANFVKDYYERAQWFFQGALFEAANLWKLDAESLIPLLLIVIVVFCVFVELIRANNADKKLVFLRWGLLLLSIPAGFIVSLASGAPSLEYRTYPVIGALCLGIPFTGLYAACRQSKRYENILFSVVLVVVLVAFVRSNNTVNRFFAFPDSIEFRFVRNKIFQFERTYGNIRTVNIVPAKQTLAAPFERHDYGEPTLRHIPNVGPFVKAALSDAGVNREVKVTYSDAIVTNSYCELLPKPGNRVDFLPRCYSFKEVEVGLLSIDMNQLDLK